MGKAGPDIYLEAQGYGKLKGHLVHCPYDQYYSTKKSSVRHL